MPEQRRGLAGSIGLRWLAAGLLFASFLFVGELGWRSSGGLFVGLSGGHFAVYWLDPAKFFSRPPSFEKGIFFVNDDTLFDGLRDLLLGCQHQGKGSWYVGISVLLPAAACFVLSMLSPGMRKRRRHRRGLCVQCGYDRRGLPDGTACPECGTGAPPAPQHTEPAPQSADAV